MQNYVKMMLFDAIKSWKNTRGGGVTFALVKTLKPVEESGKKAEANKFAVVKNSNTCYTVYAPTNAKYLGVHVYYKQAGSSSFGNRKI